MKLIRFGEFGKEKPGVLLDTGERKEIAAFGEDYNENFFATDGPRRLITWFKQNAASCKTIDSNLRLGPPIVRPSKIICVGLNYRDHAKETNSQIPKEPIIFMKATSAIVGPNDNLVIPKFSEKTDWEVELAVVIGERASYVEEKDAYKHVAGYMLHGDYSERAFQLERGGQWSKGKSCDTFAPIGPFLATADEILDPHNLNLWLTVNGVFKQKSSTAEMEFTVPFLISYISQFMSLLPGDIISTGTPAGVGLGMKPPEFIKPGDVIVQGIDGLGSSTQTAIALDK